MAIKRGPDGVPIEEPSVKVTVDKEPGSDEPLTQAGSPGDEEPTIKGFDKPAPTTTAGDSLFLDDPPTVPARVADPPPAAKPDDPTIVNEKRVDDMKPAAHAPPAEPAIVDSGEPKTTVAGFGRARTAQSTQNLSADPMTDPVAGWLVIINGPGKGRVLNIGYGQNSIGRGDDERIKINYGDSDISRSNHLTVTYDARGKTFYIQPGTGTNLSYLEGEATPLLSPKVLEPYSHITIGSTTLRFVPLCSESFFWDE